MARTPKRTSISAWESEAVGSSRMRIDGDLETALAISTSCCDPTGRLATVALGSIATPRSPEDLAGLRLRPRVVDEQASLARLVGEEDVLGHLTASG